VNSWDILGKLSPYALNTIASRGGKAYLDGICGGNGWNCEGQERHKAVGFSIPAYATENQKRLFDQIAGKHGAWLFHPTSIRAAIDALKTVADEHPCNCIKTLTWAGHGFSSKSRGKRGLVLSQSENWSDFSSLKKEIEHREIRFCRPCLIQIHSCRANPITIQELSAATGCRVIGATGSCRPNNKNPNKWDSVSGTWDERKLDNRFYESTNGSIPVPATPQDPVPDVPSGGTVTQK
jgi:hypothetical protein